MNKSRLTGLLIILLSLFIILGGIVLTDAWLRTPLPLDREMTVEIKRGMTGKDIARLLEDRGIISSALSFRWAIWIKDAERDLRLGTVHLEPPLTLSELVNLLQRKTPHLIKVQLNEGWPSWRIFRTLSKRLNLSREGFRKLFDDQNFLKQYGIPGQTLEGYLFPDTYYVSADANHRQVLGQILERFNEIRAQLDLQTRAERVGLTVDEAVNLASIIEREATIPRERPIISGVFHNRLDKGYHLQADPTLLYPIKNFEAPITHSMLNEDDPYNTYARRGLPPTPICNPGESSLRASVQPADVPYLYFVSKGDGSHAFNESLREHRQDVRKYQKIID